MWFQCEFNISVHRPCNIFSLRSICLKEKCLPEIFYTSLTNFSVGLANYIYMVAGVYPSLWYHLAQNRDGAGITLLTHVNTHPWGHTYTCTQVCTLIHPHPPAGNAICFSLHPANLQRSVLLCRSHSQYIFTLFSYQLH